MADAREQAEAADVSETSNDDGAAAVDFAFLSAQTFSDLALERELLTLFVAQARRIVADLPTRTTQDQADATHLLKGSARAIGAWATADAAEAYERTPPDARAPALAALRDAFDRAEAAISRRLRAHEG